MTYNLDSLLDLDWAGLRTDAQLAIIYDLRVLAELREMVELEDPWDFSGRLTDCLAEAERRIKGEE